MKTIKTRYEKNALTIDRSMINQAELSRRTGYSQTYISYILRGQRTNDKLLNKIKEIIRETGKAA